MGEDMTPTFKQFCPYCGSPNYRHGADYSDLEDDDRCITLPCHCTQCGNDFTEYFKFEKIEKGI